MNAENMRKHWANTGICGFRFLVLGFQWKSRCSGAGCTPRMLRLPLPHPSSSGSDGTAPARRLFFLNIGISAVFP
ncbi:MAG: hypothetical protein NTV22_03690 [bacterium]|nr:hypothetical protein [bacterium]